MKFGVKSDRGIIRTINEDSYNILAGYTGIPVTFIIADGMGGHNSGEVASKTAVDFISKYILQYPETVSSEESNIQSALDDIIAQANRYVYDMSREHQANAGMGTTLIIAVVCNKKLHIGHVGDSRAYVLREGAMTQITTDHSYIEELIRNGSITREQAENHPKRNVITRALGCSDEIQVDFYTSQINEGDTFMLCTDGLTNMLDEVEIKSIIESFEDPESACEKLVERANEKGGEDNITVIVFKY